MGQLASSNAYLGSSHWGTGSRAANQRGRVHALRAAPVTWHRQDKNGQRLPPVSTCLGHGRIDSPAHYLTLQKLSRCFEHSCWWRCDTPEHSLLGPCVRRILLEHIVADRDLALNTQWSCSDSLCLLLSKPSPQRSNNPSNCQRFSFLI
jgi:hypothetical protein